MRLNFEMQFASSAPNRCPPSRSCLFPMIILKRYPLETDCIELDSAFRVKWLSLLVYQNKKGRKEGGCADRFAQYWFNNGWVVRRFGGSCVSVSPRMLKREKGGKGCTVVFAVPEVKAEATVARQRYRRAWSRWGARRGISASFHPRRYGGRKVAVGSPRDRERGTLNYNPLRDTAEFAFKIKRA